MRRVNVVILVLLVVAVLILLQRNLLSLRDFLHRESSYAGAVLPFEAELLPDLAPEVERKGPEIPVVITAADERLGAVIAAVNSIYQNSKANVVFTIVTFNDTVDHLRQWLSLAAFRNLKYRIVIFNSEVLIGKISNDPKVLEATKPLTFARYYLPLYVTEAEKVIYLDDDVIVQGDIQELYDTSIKPGHAAAFSEDCDSASSKGVVRGAGSQVCVSLPSLLSHPPTLLLQTNYLGFLDFKKESIKKLGMRANTCSFNPGVIVANLTEWRTLNITGQLEHWMELNAREDLYSKMVAESFTTPPLLLVFYRRHSTIDPMWHVRHLGTTGSGSRYSPQFVKAAKLLHWNGHYKPWGRASSFSDVWDKWFVPDPSGKFHPVHKHAGD